MLYYVAIFSYDLGFDQIESFIYFFVLHIFKFWNLFWWSFKWSLLLNCLPHFSQWCLIFEWFLMTCSYKPRFLSKDFGHCWHWRLCWILNPDFLDLDSSWSWNWLIWNVNVALITAASILLQRFVMNDASSANEERRDPREGQTEGGIFIF